MIWFRIKKKEEKKTNEGLNIQEEKNVEKMMIAILLCIVFFLFCFFTELEQ
jgi:hypothetical protein